MNHRPFEDWLLDDQPLSPQQKRDLQAHMITCTSCSAIAESNLALHAARQLRPAPGFTDRFGLRLAARRREQRWRMVAGTLVLVFGGLGLLYWLAGPMIQSALQSPATWIATGINYLLFLITSVQVLSKVSVVLLRAVTEFVSPAALIFFALIGGGLGILWSMTIWRVGRATQGA